MQRKFTSGLLIGAAYLFILLPALTAQINPTLLSQYQIIDELVEAKSGTTKAALRIIVSGPLTKSSLTRLLRRVHARVQTQIQIQSNALPAQILIWAYLSKLHLHSKELWLASLEQKGTVGFQIYFNEAHLKQLHAPSQPLFQLTEETRKLIWQELQAIRKKSQLEAFALFPLKASALSEPRQFFRLSKQSTLLLAEAGALDPPAVMTGAVNLPPQTTITLLHSILLQNRRWHYVQAVIPLVADPTEGWIDSLDLSRQVQPPTEEYYEQIHKLTESIQFGYQFELSEKYRLASQQLDAILLEGILRNWPLAQEK